MEKAEIVSKTEQRIIKLIARQGADAARVAEKQRKLRTKAMIILGGLLIKESPSDELKKMLAEWDLGIRDSDREAWKLAMREIELNPPSRSPAGTNEGKTKGDEHERKADQDKSPNELADEKMEGDGTPLTAPIGKAGFSHPTPKKGGGDELPL